MDFKTKRCEWLGAREELICRIYFLFKNPCEWKPHFSPLSFLIGTLLMKAQEDRLWHSPGQKEEKEKKQTNKPGMYNIFQCQFHHFYNNNEQKIVF